MQIAHKSLKPSSEIQEGKVYKCPFKLSDIRYATADIYITMQIWVKYAWANMGEIAAMLEQ